MKKVIAAMFSLIALPCLASDPVCDGPNNYAAAVTFVYLKNAGITDNEKIDFNLTTVKRLASEKIEKDLYRQVHLVTYVEKSGKVIKSITVNDASSEECSMSEVEVYVIDKQFGR